MRVVLVALVLMLGACTQPMTESTSPVATAASTSSITTTTLSPSVTATTPLSVAAVFLAVVEEATEDSALAGFVDEDPESVLAFGQLFCELRDIGLTDEEALVVYLEGVGSQQELTEDDAVFAGVVFGAAEQTLCPTTE